MSKKLSIADFRAVRSVLEPHEFAVSDGQDVPPSDLIDEKVWDGIMHLPEDVSIRISSHNGTRLSLLYDLWGDWLTAIGNPDEPDKIYDPMLEAADCFKGATFNLLHGYYRLALTELRTALELLMIGTYGSLYPTSTDYTAWEAGLGELSFTRCRKHLLGNLRKNEGKWIFENDEFIASSYQVLCNYTHSRPNANYGTLWQSNGPVYNNAAIKLTFDRMLSVFAICYLLVRVARPDAVIPNDSKILFELDWIPHHGELVRAFTDLYGT